MYNSFFLKFEKKPTKDTFGEFPFFYWPTFCSEHAADRSEHMTWASNGTGRKRSEIFCSFTLLVNKIEFLDLGIWSEALEAEAAKSEQLT